MIKRGVFSIYLHLLKCLQKYTDIYDGIDLFALKRWFWLGGGSIPYPPAFPSELCSQIHNCLWYFRLVGPWRGSGGWRKIHSIWIHTYIHTYTHTYIHIKRHAYIWMYIPAYDFTRCQFSELPKFPDFHNSWFAEIWKFEKCINLEILKSCMYVCNVCMFVGNKHDSVCMSVSGMCEHEWSLPISWGPMDLFFTEQLHRFDHNSVVPILEISDNLKTISSYFAH